MTKTLEERFWEKVDIVQDQDSCWEWTASLNKGRGQIHIAKGVSPMSAPRLSYIINIGEVSRDLEVGQSCGNLLCVRPSHLILGTHQEMMDNAVQGDRIPRGSGVHNSPLTEEDVLNIRTGYLSGKTIFSLASSYGVQPMCISLIIRSKTWKHVDNPCLDHLNPSGNFLSKFSEDQVRQMRELREQFGYGYKDIAEMFNADLTTAWRICKYKTHKDVV